MILVIAALFCLASVPLAGGRLAALAELRIRATWTIVLALGVQVVVVSVAPGGSHAFHAGVHLASYVLAAAFVWANRRVPGMLLVALGGALNLAAISANGGVMPAWPTALRIAGLRPTGGYENSAAVAHPRLQALGDVIPVPGPWPIGNVLSVGDLILFAGTLLLLHRTCRPGRAAGSTAARTPRGSDAAAAAPRPGLAAAGDHPSTLSHAR